MAAVAMMCIPSALWANHPPLDHVVERESGQALGGGGGGGRG
jgi:hypothetical protein